MTDTFEFHKSTLPQGLDLGTPYSSKQYQYVNDINSGIYSQNGLTLVQFDLSSIYNSATMVDMSQAFITIPLVQQIAYVSNTTTGALVAPAAGAWAALGLKSGYYQLLNGYDIQVNGKTLEQYQGFSNAAITFKMLSTMSQDDLNNLGPSLGLGNALDSWNALRYNNNFSSTATQVFPAQTSTTSGGNGLSNCYPYGLANPNAGDQTAYGVQGVGTYNKGFYSRLIKVADTTAAATSQNLYNVPTVGGAGILSASNAAAEFKTTYQNVATNYGTVYDVAILRVSDIMDCMAKWPIAKRVDANLRIYLNTGSLGVSVLQTGTAAMQFSAASSTFTNTCPLLVSGLLTAGYPATTVGIAASLSIGRAASTSIFGVNFASSGAANPMTSCRFYFPQVQLKADIMRTYISENRAKKVCWTSFLSNQFASITAGSSFSQLVQSGCSNIRGVLIIPTLAAGTNGLLNGSATPTTGITPFSQYLSPFDCCPAQTGPISLINLQVSVGGINQLQNTLSFDYENFLEQVNHFGKINSSDVLGLTCGLISEAYWTQAYRTYYVDCSRGQNADLMTPRNITVSFTNNTQQSIDVLMFTFYENSCVVDVETGVVRSL